jgi:hypothetical protein
VAERKEGKTKTKERKDGCGGLLGFGPVGENKGSTAGGDEEKGARGEGEKGKCHREGC